VLAALVLVYFVQRHVAQNRLAAAVDTEVGAARGFIDAAHASDEDHHRRAKEAYKLFDAGDNDAGEAAWRTVEASRTAAEKAYRAAGKRIEDALAKDPTRGDVRAILGDILYERAVLADLVHAVDRRDELVERLAAYDADGTHRAHLTEPGRLVVHAPGAELVLEPGHRALGTGEVDLPLAPGTYTVLASAAVREQVRASILVERGERAEVQLALPRAGSLPAGFVYVTGGRFLYGSAAETLARGYFDAVPLHPRTTNGFLIARTEVTIAEWLEFVAAQPEAAQAAVLPNMPSKIGGSVVIDRPADRGSMWRFKFQPMEHAYVALWGEPVEYTGRDRRVREDWRRFPITGVSARESEQYVAWLDRSGRVPGARLCNELEWEHAARGADGRVYPNDRPDRDDINVDLTYTRDLMGLDEVGAHPTSTSPYGVVDMSGNAFEWTHADHGDAYIARGGSYYHDRNTANLSNRTTQTAGLHDATLGLRVCTTPDPAAFR